MAPHGSEPLRSFQLLAVPPRTTVPGAQHRHPNDTAVAHIKQRMGSDAALLDYLAVDTIRLEPLDEENRPETARPYQMYVGKLPQDRDDAPAQHLRALIHIGPANGPPDIRYHIFSDEGHSLRLIKAKDAFEEAEIYPPFTSLLEAGGIIESQVRAMVRYCFLVKRANLKNMWQINDQFIKDLVAACKTAQANSASPAPTKPIRRGISEQERALRDRPASYEEFWMQSVDSLNNRNERSRKRSMKVSGLHHDENGKHATGDSSLWDKPRKATRTTRQPLQRRENDMSATATSVEGTSLKPAMSNTPYGAPPTPQSIGAKEQPGEHVEHSSHDTSNNGSESFIATYTQLLEEDNCYKEELKEIQDAQNVVTQEIERQQNKLDELRDDENRVKQVRKRGKDKQDTLHHSLSERERALLAYGIQLGSRSTKRVRFGEEHAGENDTRGR